MLSNKVIASWAIGLAVLGATAITVLWLIGSGQHASTRLDAIRTALSIVFGGGGAAGLLLTARRQRTTELDIEIKSHDATEARITELYGKAAEQLGNDKAPVRLAGLFALERLAQGHPEHRQTIVDLICAYLRMPFDATASDEGTSDAESAAAPVQEQEVRDTAQTVLAGHLRADEGAADLFWPDIRVNLAGATLSTFGFAHCHVHHATFAGARFVGPAVFRGATFDRQGDFRSARFTGLAEFRRVTFGGEGANFRGAEFEGEVQFGTRTVATVAEARTVTTDGIRRRWPDGWVERADPEREGWARLVRSGGESSR